MAKKIIIIISLFIGLLALAIGLFLFLKNKPASKIPLVPSQPYGFYEASKILDSAVKERNPGQCDKLSGEEKDNCLNTVATFYGDKDLCQLIQNETLKKDCLDFAKYRQAVKSNDWQPCLALQTVLKNQCLREIFSSQSDLNLCKKLSGADQTFCQDIIYRNQALAQKNPELCAKIQSPVEKANCQKEIADLPADSDNDGVLDMIERVNGTDPFDPQSK
jgi:hypothetical protein